MIVLDPGYKDIIPEVVIRTVPFAYISEIVKQPAIPL
jgi:hypothetical protein